MSEIAARRLFTEALQSELSFTADADVLKRNSFERIPDLKDYFDR